MLSKGFDEILTTNYSYELELAALNCDRFSSDNRLKNMSTHTCEVKKSEAKYMLHTYNSVNYSGSENHIWHIHGEARKPNSMILGHYYYANYLCRLKEISDKRKNIYQMNQRDNKETIINSWFDAFVMGDVYIIGFGFSLSELDLWWLLNRKKREKANHGRVYFYEIVGSKPEEYAQKAKYELLKAMGCEVEVILAKGDWEGEYFNLIDQLAP